MIEQVGKMHIAKILRQKCLFLTFHMRYEMNMGFYDCYEGCDETKTKEMTNMRCISLTIV